jgi:NTE family protein
MRYLFRSFWLWSLQAFVNNNIKIDIIAGTSIRGVNAAIIAGAKDGSSPEQLLEQFWFELAENSVDVATPLADWLFGYKPLKEERLTLQQNSLKSMLSSYSSAVYGNDKMFIARWRPDYASADPQYYLPKKWTYLYDHSPLSRTLEKYIDYNKLRPNGMPNARLIMTAVSVLTAEALTFDTTKQQITPKHILATSAYPLYYFLWVKVEEDIYCWDGSLLSNTPLREVIDASAVIDKRIFIVENYPKNIDRLPDNLPEVYHRARDIMFSDKTEHNVRMSKVITQYLRYIEELYQMIEKHIDTTKVDEKGLERICRKYRKIKKEHGAEIKSIAHIIRDEPFPYLYENADFSLETVKNSIREGELKTNKR